MATQQSTIPREPSAYRPGNHFAQRVKGYGDRDRHLDGDIINSCIQDGRVFRTTSGNHKFVRWFDGVQYCLIIDLPAREVVTGFPAAIDTEAARRSDRWTDDQIDDIQHFIATDSRESR